MEYVLNRIETIRKCIELGNEFAAFTAGVVLGMAMLAGAYAVYKLRRK